MANTPETVGNQFGYLCPNCKQGNCITITCVVTCELTENGSNDIGDHEWDTESWAHCECGWHGRVKEFLQAENFEEV
jgi:hypothetical protein